MLKATSVADRLHESFDWAEHNFCRQASAAEPAQSSALPLESIDNVHGSDSLPLGVLGVGDGVSDDVLQEHLQDTPRLFIDETTDPLDSASSGQSSDSWLGNALNVVPQDFAMPLSTALTQALSSFAASSHVDKTL